MDIVRWNSGITHIKSSTYTEPASNSVEVNTSLLDLTIVCYQPEIIEFLQAGLQADKCIATIMVLQSLWCCLLLFPTKYCLRHPITRPLLFQIWLWSPASLHLIALGPYSTLLSLLFMALYLFISWDTCINYSFSKIIESDLCWQIFQRNVKIIDLKHRPSGYRLQSLAQNTEGYVFLTSQLQRSLYHG